MICDHWWLSDFSRNRTRVAGWGIQFVSTARHSNQELLQRNKNGALSEMVDQVSFLFGMFREAQRETFSFVKAVLGSPAVQG